MASANRVQVISPSDTITTAVVTAPVSIVGFGQLGIEISTISTSGALTVMVELSPDGDAFFAEPIEDPASGSASGGDFTSPIYRLIRSFTPSGDTNIAIWVPCAGYQAVRLTVKVGSSGHAAVFVNKLRLAAN